jgi:hypothetical protein
MPRKALKTDPRSVKRREQYAKRKLKAKVQEVVDVMDAINPVTRKPVKEGVDIPKHQPMTKRQLKEHERAVKKSARALDQYFKAEKKAEENEAAQKVADEVIAKAKPKEVKPDALDFADTTVTPREQRQSWPFTQVYKTAGQHHRITEDEAHEILEAIGGEEFVIATGSQVAMLSHGYTLMLSTGMQEFKVEGHRVAGLDLLAVGPVEYDLRFIAPPADYKSPDEVPDGVYCGGAKVVHVIPKVAIDKIRDTLQELGLETRQPLPETTRIKAELDAFVEHTRTCDCDGCAKVVQDAKDAGRDLLEHLGTLYPNVRERLDKLKAAETLGSMVESIKRKALEGTKDGADPKVEAALKRSTVVIPDKMTVN